MRELPENKKDALKLLNHARIDVEAARVLHASKIYSQSTYHLQQATEKTAKACVMAISAITADELKDKASHNAAKAFKLLAEVPNTAKLIDFHTTENPETLKHLKDFEKAVYEDKTKYLFATKERILAEARKAFNITVPYSENPQPMLDQALKMLGHNMSGDISDKVAELKKILNSGLAQQVTGMFLFSVLVEPHATMPRYPHNKLPLEAYKEDLGIVEATPEILDMIEPAIQKIEDYINSLVR